MEIPPKISPFNCPNCGAGMLLPESNADSTDGCPKCRRRTRVITFPALTRAARTVTTAEAVMLAGEATCFYHPQKRALIPCDLCGRFLCAMCDLEFGGQHLCPQCLETGAKKGKLESLERERTRWDQIVASTLVLPLLLCWVLLPVTSLAALGMTIWKWNAPPSRVANTRLRLVVCAVLALVELAGGVIPWWLIATNR
jgi:hypothetical protein